MKLRFWAIGLAVLGVLLVGIAVAMNAGNRSIVGRTPLATGPGETSELRFTPEGTQLHEIEIEVIFDALDEAAHAQVRVKDEPSAIDVQWQVIGAEGATVAQGGSREYLYFPAWVGTKDRYFDALLRREAHRDLQVGTIARGVGAFRARSVSEYTLRAQVGSIPEGVIAASPELVVRLNRGRAKANRSLPDRLVGFGVTSLVASLLLFGYGAIRRRV